MFRNSWNRVTLCGHLGADSDYKVLPPEKGEQVGQFRMAMNEVFPAREEGGEKREHVEWQRCYAFRGLAGVIRDYCKKGRQVLLEGRLRTTSYRKEGEDTDRFTTDVLIDNMTLLGSGNGNRQPDVSEAIADTDGAPISIPDDDIPF